VDDLVLEMLERDSIIKHVQESAKESWWKSRLYGTWYMRYKNKNFENRLMST
jgi:hypothetical protein